MASVLCIGSGVYLLAAQSHEVRCAGAITTKTIIKVQGIDQQTCDLQTVKDYASATLLPATIQVSIDIDLY